MNGSRTDTRWRTAVGPAAALVAIGLWTGEPVLLLSAMVPLGYVAYGALSSTPDVASAIAVERSLSEDTPLPGEHVTVTLRVTNESDRTIPDLRVVDAVPGGVKPVDGESAAVLTLRAGETGELSYTLLARRGKHEFDDVRVRARSLSGASVSSAEIEASGDGTMFCRVDVADAPIRDQTRRFVGALPTTTGGAGIEFHSTRTYRRGDPMNRIDWRRLAKTGELTTVDYRIREAARVVVVVDARDAASVRAGPRYPSSRELSSYAAELLTGVLLDERHEVGIGVFGMDLPGTRGSGAFSFLPPSSGETFRATVAAVCGAIAAGDPNAVTELAAGQTPTTDAGKGQTDTNGDGAGNGGGDGNDEGDPGSGGDDSGWGSDDRGWGDSGTSLAGNRPSTDGGISGEAATGTGGGGETAGQTRGQLTQLRGYLDAQTQVLFVTPALDDFPVTVTETLEGHGHSVTVLSPDVTDRETLGGRLARVRRGARIESLRALGARVVDWSLSTPLPIAVADAFEGVR